ncbi:MAG TPA: hypothetical protein VF576_08455 [Rubricoccaceae bacterium]
MRLALLAVVLVAPALAPAAQPAPDALVDAWRRGWQAASRTVDRVALDEALTRRVEGPRGTATLETRGTVSFDAGAPGGRAVRRLRSATVDGREVDVDRVAELDRRLVRAFGGGSEESARPPLLPSVALARATAVGVQGDAVDGRPAWRVALRMPDARPGRRGRPSRPDRAEAWFTRSADAPRLLRIRVEGDRPHGAAFARTVEYDRTDGLDLPSAMATTIEVRQRRRLRVYATTVATEARYRRPVIVRR